MVLEPQGFVARIAEDLERTISQGRLPKDGSLPSEQMLAKSYGVSRSTVREALKQLAARGVVVQHPGRRNRAARLDVAITLENLSVALHDIGPAHPERLRLLEGYLSLKRETAVELLAACCEHASERELAPLIDACFALAEDTRWKPEARQWVEREFELLRLAACVAVRPGHFLLVQSLEKSFGGMAGKLVPHLDAKAMYQWAMCAFHALGERDAQAVRRDLPALLKACDERLLSRLTPAPETRDKTATPPDASASPASPDAATVSNEVFPDFEAEPACAEKSILEPTLSGAPATFAGEPPEGTPPEPTTAVKGELSGPVCASRSACPTGSCQTRPTGGASPRGREVDRPCCHHRFPEDHRDRGVSAEDMGADALAHAEVSPWAKDG
ncbi:GntR family transcriptional regulator [Hyalangium minutum]|uniref:GntR family transcriptional regulator n=1 Tax=Hyalangium minutum TaxID=394096 RepID=UPI000694C26F|nr:GntR family transcriptional regulator [Hyalangium minutum]